MDSAALDSFTPLLDGVDRWGELAPLLPLLVLLEIILSADNAVALASITKGLKNIQLQRKALNISIIFSLVLRIGLILAANIIIKYTIIQVIASFYLLSIVINKFIFSIEQDDTQKEFKDDPPVNFFKITALLAFTDLAFSVDSVTAAVAISDQFLLVITGAIIGVIALRFTSGLFIRWLEEFTRLEISGYIAVGIVGLKLLILLIMPGIIIPEWLIFFIMLSLFLWGFSKRQNSVVT